METAGRLVNFATPGTEVRPEARFILGGQPPQTFVVNRTYENIIRWPLARVGQAAGDLPGGQRRARQVHRRGGLDRPPAI
jgi:hypothetical protein